MRERHYPQLGETLQEERLENGLCIYLFPKPEFGKNFAFFATNYGGMDTRFQWRGEWLDTPLGVAHFLEHKMFDTKDGNALQTLSASGASPNAFTSSALTGYYFEGTEGFYKNLKTLLSFVSEAYFTKESVSKEQGIIGQEIRMIEDNPEWQLYMNLLAGLYRNHPVRNSVAGSQASIAEITDETLYTCHEAFYHPGNMVLCVAGHVDLEEISRIAREILPQEARQDTPRDYGEAEPDAAFEAYRELPMEVSAPMFQLGFKLRPETEPRAQLRQKLLCELLCEAWIGTSSPLYAELYREGLITADFSYGFEDYPGACFLTFGGESRDPKAVRERALSEARRLGREGVDPALFDRLKKAAYGGRVRGMNGFEHLCVEQARAYFAGQDVWIFPELYATIDRKDLEVGFLAWISEEAMSMAVVIPGERKT